ncbi:MATE family efflux transporter [Cellulosimicrobium terreum]|nr:MATE family efflux transporter [Cellulosimicrobium terreum]
MSISTDQEPVREPVGEQDRSTAADPTPGELRRSVVRLAGPVCLALVVGALAQLAVAALLGHMGDDALYVRSLYIPVAFLVLALQEGLDVSTQVGFARLRGSGGRVRPARSLLVLGVAGTALLVVVALAVLLVAPALAGLLDVPAERARDFVTFTRWMALTSVLSVPTVVAAAALRGWGRTTPSALLSLLAAGVQVGGVWLVGLVGGTGVMSVPVSAALSAVVAGGAALVLLRRHGLLQSPTVRLTTVRTPTERRTTLHLSTPRLPASLVRPGDGVVDARALLLGIGLPVGLSYLLLTVTNLVTVWVVGPWGTDVVAGYGAAATVQTLLVVPAIGFAAATSVVMNQQWGGGLLRLLPVTLRAATVVVAGMYVAIGLLALLAAPAVARLMAADPAVTEQTTLYLRIVGPSLAGTGIVLFLITVLEQLGYGRTAVLLNVVYFATSLGVGGVLARSGGGPVALYWTIAAVNAVALAVVLPIAVRLVRRRADEATP